MKTKRPLSHLFFAVTLVLATGHALASTVVEADYDINNCDKTPEHEYMAKLSAEFGSAEEFNHFLSGQYGCALKVDEDYLGEVLQKYKYQQVITNTGNTYYEGLEACGYHPQREEFACSMSIRRRFGFAGAPSIYAGSNEWVTICVDYGNGLQLMDTASVHVHDEPFGNPPNWYYAAVIQADERLQAQVQQGQTLRARAILSWAAAPTSCSYQPVWGNQADFRIKLDP